jgi:hypothetical protein
LRSWDWRFSVLESGDWCCGCDVGVVLRLIRRSDSALTLRPPVSRERLLAAYAELAWERLAQVYPAALAIQEQERAAAEAAAWAAVLTDLADSGDLVPGSLALLNAADRDAYRLLVDGDRVDITTPGAQAGIPLMLEDLSHESV